MDKIEEVLTRGVEKIYPSKEILEKILRSGKKIKLYNGIDPSGPTLHLGHMVVLQKLRQFQELGHKVILLIGDFTAMIGDPTDKKATRKKLTHKEVLENAKDYKKQVAKILKFTGENPVEIKFNSQWHSKLSAEDLLSLASHFTASQMWERDMFQERLKKGKEVWLHEFLYPLLQAYDSVVMDVDLEIGGNDQTFNMLCGRTLMKILKRKEKFVLTTKLLAEPGKPKMGKTEGKMIGLNEEPNEIFGKIMSWPDEMIIPGFTLLTNIPLLKIKEMEKKIKSPKTNPMDFKKKLAFEIVSIIHSKNKAESAQKEFEKVFQKNLLPSYQVPTYKIKKGEKLSLNKILVESKIVSSNSEAKRLIKQKAVEIDGKIITDYQLPLHLEDGTIIKIGKKKFLKICKEI